MNLYIKLYPLFDSEHGEARARCEERQDKVPEEVQDTCSTSCLNEKDVSPLG